MIIGLGHNKAQQGKNTIAKYLQDKYGFTIIRFSDALYEECKNCNIFLWDYMDSEREVKIYSNNLRDNMGRLKAFDYKELPLYFQKWLLKNCRWERNWDNWYNGMKEKDSVLLQWWGTDFRRKYFGEDYWINVVKNKINILRRYIDIKNNGSMIVLRTTYISLESINIVIPDCRFKNEAQMVKDFGGEVWNVRRYKWKKHIVKHNIPETIEYSFNKKVYYISPDRDPNHASETDLDDWEFDRIIEAESGDIESLYLQIDNIMKEFKYE